jgi:hypothetical protein
MAQAVTELRYALFALGIGTNPGDVPAFLEAFARLPCETDRAGRRAIDQQSVAFITLVHQLLDAAVARTQRMRLQHTRRPCFVSYARADEPLAREIVKYLEAKGADVWWDLGSLVLGVPLEGGLRSAVGGAAVVFVIASRAAAQSEYVRMELEAAIAQGVSIVPIAPDGSLPDGIASLLASATVGPVISALETERAAVPALALRCLERSPAEQLHHLTTDKLYQSLSDRLARQRARSGWKVSTWWLHLKRSIGARYFHKLGY